MAVPGSPKGWHQSQALPAHPLWDLERRTRAHGQVLKYPERSTESSRKLSLWLHELDPEAKSKKGIWPFSAARAVSSVQSAALQE